MAPDWRKFAFAVIAATALGAGTMTAAFGQAAKGPNAGAQADEDADDAAKSQPGAKSAGKKKQDPAEARRIVDAASKLVDAGKNEEAARALSTALSGGNLPPATLAKAFYVRGLAYKQQGKTAQAISDFTSALWLKGGLGGSERADAIKHRSAAYREAGLADPGETAVAEAPKSKSWWGGETGSTGSSSSSGGSGSNWFNNIFGGASSASAASKVPEAKEPEAKAKAEPSPAAKGPSASGWASGTEVNVQKEARADPRPEPPPPAAKAAPPPVAKAPPSAAEPPAPPPSAKAGGRFKVQLGAVRTQAEAQALASKAKREYASALAAREPEIAQAVYGNMGSFYLVRVGPFATVQETQAVCAKLKGSGFDCMSVTR